jgi:hypothetical protein
MNQDVAVRNAQFGVLAVRIADADNANLGHGDLLRRVREKFRVDFLQPCPHLFL